MPHKIKFLGASGTVTGSCYVLSNENNCHIMIDCGMYQGNKELEDLNRKPIDFDTRQLAGMILTHAHLDHCGRIPILYTEGYRKKIYMTKATRKLSEVVMRDAAHIAEFEVPENPLYTQDDVVALLNQVQVVQLNKPYMVGDYEVTMVEAGHLLGSTSLIIRDTTDNKVFAFSGDLGNSPQNIERPTQMINQADCVVMESTYGDRGHGTENPDQVLMEEIQEIEKTGGTLLIPAFALERTQELLHRINHLKKDNKIKKETPVFLDGPMAVKALRIYKQFKMLFNEELAAHARTEDPFDFNGLHIVERPAESREIRKILGAKIVISGSGMMSGGRVLKHAITFLPSSKTRLLLVGYQGEETLGREIFEGNRQVFINDQHVTIRANVRATSCMSNHADQTGLYNWFTHIKGVKKLFLTHGDEEPRAVFKQKILDSHGITDINLPEVDQEFTID
jgi:metallo-beta-lactamase family protein